MVIIEKVKLLISDKFSFVGWWKIYCLFLPYSALYVIANNFHPANPFSKKMIFSQIWYYKIIKNNIVSFASDKTYHQGIEWLIKSQYLNLLPKSQFEFKKSFLSNIKF